MSSWLNTIVYRKSISYLRKEVKSNQEISFEELQNFSFPDMQTPMDDMLSREEIQCLNEAINSLPPKCKEIFILGCIEGLSYKDVSEQLGVSVNTVKTQVKVAYKKIKSEFGDRDKNFMLILCNSFFKEEAGQ